METNTNEKVESKVNTEMYKGFLTEHRLTFPNHSFTTVKEFTDNCMDFLDQALERRRPCISEMTFIFLMKNDETNEEELYRFFSSGEANEEGMDTKTIVENLLEKVDENYEDNKYDGWSMVEVKDLILSLIT